MRSERKKKEKEGMKGVGLKRKVSWDEKGMRSVANVMKVWKWWQKGEKRAPVSIFSFDLFVTLSSSHAAF